MIKIDESLIERISKLKAMGGSETEIESILQLDRSVSEIFAVYEEEKNFKNVEQTADMLREHLEVVERGTWNVSKVYRLKKDGLLIPVDKNPSKRVGYRFPVENIRKFIDFTLATKEDLQTKINVLEKELKKSTKTIIDLGGRLGKGIADDLNENEDQEFVEELSFTELDYYHHLLKDVTNWDEKRAQKILEEETHVLIMDQMIKEWDTNESFKKYGYNQTKEEFEELDYDEQQEIVCDVYEKEGWEFYKGLDHSYFYKKN